MILPKNLPYAKLIAYKKFSKPHVLNSAYVINIRFKCSIFFSTSCERRLTNSLKRKYHLYFINKAMVRDPLSTFNTPAHSLNQYGINKI